MNIRRSPRLNPPPRRSPRIKEQSESEAEEDSTPQTILPEKQSTTTENDDNDTTARHSPREAKTKTKSPSSSVKFRRTRIVQNFDGNEPANRIHRRTLTQNKSSIGKRLFRESSGEYPQGNRKKRIKNLSNKPHQHRSVFKDHPNKVCVCAGVGAAMLTIAVGKVLGWW